MNGVYEVLAKLAAPEDPAAVRLNEVMVIADALITCGEDRSWPSVWWAYAALHYDMRDEALDRAIGLLESVEHPTEAVAAALMLRAEIKMTQAAYASTDPSAVEQESLLERAVALAPKWPALRLRLARAAKAGGHEGLAAEHGAAALALIRELGPSPDPFDSAITGRNLDYSYVEGEVATLEQRGG
jgi:hypothetical protein